jgi:hypothetical protein
MQYSDPGPILVAQPNKQVSVGLKNGLGIVGVFVFLFMIILCAGLMSVVAGSTDKPAPHATTGARYGQR